MFWILIGGGMTLSLGKIILLANRLLFPDTVSEK